MTAITLRRAGGWTMCNGKRIRYIMLTARGAVRSFSALEYGAIAQLGERLHGMQEVGGSIPPGSTSLRLLRKLRLGKPRLALSWRSKRRLPRRSPEGEGGPRQAAAPAAKPDCRNQ